MKEVLTINSRILVILSRLISRDTLLTMLPIISP
jgi:hypothetical protein